ncbi:hypothetical protein ACIRNU_12150 [Streptomyces rochei]|uniref:hypothetical protein n=1 Tax=Streptomyces rochei TaxID=1928 RepID=UPI00381E6C0A
MHAVPDGVEVVASWDGARHLDSPPLLVLDAVTGFLDTHGIGGVPLAWQRIGDGHADIIYLLAAIFCEAIDTRRQRGERPHDKTFGPSLETGVPRLLEQAGRYAGPAATARR